MASLDRKNYRTLNKHYESNGQSSISLPGQKPPLWKHFFALNGKLLDDTILNLMEYVFYFGSGSGSDDQVTSQFREALETYRNPSLLEDPNPFFLSDESPDRVRISEQDSLSSGKRMIATFESNYEPFDKDFADEFHSYLGNETCRIHYWRHDDHPRPTIVILHSWCGGWLWMEERFMKAQDFYDEGYNLAFVTLPFHGKRTPEQALFSGQMFPSTDLKLTMEAFGQAIHDIHSALEWIRDDQQNKPVGLMGLSLGGYLTGLVASLDDDLDFAVPMIAPASFADILWYHGEDRPLQEAARAEGLSLEDLRDMMAIFCPLHYSLKVPRENVFIVAGLGDRIVPPCHSLTLWRHWDQPRMSWYPGSHMLHTGRSKYLHEIKDWINSLNLRN
ncbi:MAG: alpha/beta hydrolase [bacterium]